ncbi:MAG: galactokinase, partial [Anaerolineales bacterium]
MDLIEKFDQTFHKKAQVFARAPGRVNILGEHIDYNQGAVLPMAIDREVNILACKNSDPLQVHLVAMDLDEEIIFSLADLDLKVDIHHSPLPRWALYPAGVAWVLQKKGYLVEGVEAVFRSSIPIGAGLSSSAAVEVGFAMMWSAFGGWEEEPLQLAQDCQRAENEYVGVSCGLLDQFSSVCGVENHVLFFDTRNLEWKALPFFENTQIVIVDSKVERSLTSSQYNQRRKTCEEAVLFLQKFKPEMRSLRDITPIEFAAYGEYLPNEIRKRSEHVVKEIARVFSAVTALQRNDYRSFGALMYASHYSLRDLYEVSHPNLDFLVDQAHAFTGCFGARLTGAGFGGCTVNMV